MTARLAFSGVEVALGGRRVVHDVTADLPSGSLVALVGPNGAGKTTLLRAAAGLTPSTGTIRLDGRPLDALTVAERARRIGYLPQGHQAHWPLPARQIVALGRFAHGARDPARLTARDAAIIDEAMARADCAAFAAQNVQTLSGGERARVMLARVLAGQAAIVLADEPTAALDPRHQLGVMQALRAEAARGALVIAVTHDIMLAGRFADRVLLMQDGRLVADGPPAAVLEPATLSRVYGVSSRMVEIDGQPLALPWGAL